MTTTRGPAATRAETAASRSSAPARRIASASFGSSRSACAIAADRSGLAHRPDGSQLVSSDVMTPAERAAENNARQPGPEAILEQEPRAGVHVPRAGQQLSRDVGRGQRGHRAQRGQDGPVPAAGQRHRHPGGRVLADRHEADVDPLGGQLVPHELTRGVGADRGDQRDAQPQPRRGHRGDRGRTRR